MPSPGLWVHLLHPPARHQCQALPTRGNDCARWVGGKGSLWRSLEGQFTGALWRSKVTTCPMYYGPYTNHTYTLINTHAGPWLLCLLFSLCSSSNQPQSTSWMKLMLLLISPTPRTLGRCFALILDTPSSLWSL